MNEVEHLFEKLTRYAESDFYPYHMPGHKRRGFGMLPEELYKLDITEIDGFDNLHKPEDILRCLQDRAAALYGAEESFYLVNGSTCGILSAVSCALPAGGHILMARNCHKAAYHAAYLRGLSVTYLYPPYLEEYDIYDGIEPWQVRQALEREPDIKAVLIVSPTYEGRISDIRAIAHIAHEKGIPLIVDEAHGAHLGLSKRSVRNSCQLGADLVIHSVHKTLPALTQSALLHVNGNLIDRGLARRFLGIYQSSSPSYLLMAGIDNAVEYIGLGAERLFRYFREQYDTMLEQLAACRHLRILRDIPERQDTGKLLISVKRSEITGKQMYDMLHDKYHLQLEMASESFVLAMFTVNDGRDAYWRMTEALLAIDSWLEEQARRLRTKTPCKERTARGCAGTKAVAGKGNDAVPLAAAWDMSSEWIGLTESVGRHIGEFINLYPPGVPLLVPGEVMTEPLCGRIRNAIEQGLEVQGIQARAERDEQHFFIPVIREEQIKEFKIVNKEEIERKQRLRI